MIEQLESELRSALRARADQLPARAGARVRAQDYRPRTRDLRPPVAAGVLATAAAAAAAVLLIDLGPSTSEAFAGWTRVPTHASTAQVNSATSDCRTRLQQPPPGAVNATRNPPADVSSMTPILTDTRGAFTFVVFTGADNSGAWCISGPDFTSASMSSGDGGSAAPAGKIAPTSLEHTAHGGDAYSFVEGRAGAGVTAATLVLSDGSKVQATIQNGWLVAWWPGSAQLASAQVTTAGGTSTQSFDTRSMQCPPPPAGGSASQDTMCSGGFNGTGRGRVSGSVSVQGASALSPALGSRAGSTSSGN